MTRNRLHSGLPYGQMIVNQNPAMVAFLGLCTFQIINLPGLVIGVDAGLPPSLRIGVPISMAMHHNFEGTPDF